MKTLSLMIALGALNIGVSEATSQLLYSTSIDGDSSFALFIIGVVSAVFIAKDRQWV